MTYIEFKKDKMNYEGALRALEFYYDKFGTQESITVNLAARMAGVTGLEAHFFMAELDSLGMPDNRKEAETYLRNVRDLLGKLKE
ncbi:MAG TPA: hypothetical protein VJB66_01990 [Candidatus Nanoarchaeia archaeon]|nr:hypothetical protein [Candidatus Nanoarchaeia archaeon]